ncbi:hypothetical protein [Aquisalimonas sp.]|uniref:hypothetical protein n=1 Tax=Aquisalimonas sp. TaxID=1872621 RepID=UPI0025C50D23|nr:hypothetical protein [Aquisalimonas sp.]
MNALRVLLLSTLLAVSGHAFAQAPEADDPDASPDTAQDAPEQVYELVVRGMPSGIGRAWNAAGGLRDIDNLEILSVIPDRNRIAVRSDEQPERAAIADALQDSGMTLVYIEERG